jgi:3-deoxy-D-manno-octulosonate 8-phosphate phosphatase (KDO 8-P phosphatase)
MTISQDVQEKLSTIKIVAFDVDGVLTDGGIIYNNNRQETKRFNVKDGLAIHLLKKCGYTVGAVTGRSSDVVKMRMQELKVDFCEQGIKDKRTLVEKLLQDHEAGYEQLAYIGDDLVDLPVLKRCGFACCPADARSYIQQQVDWVTPSAGGNGAFRDLADLLLQANGQWDELVAENYS